jgi:3-hydroxymyristoyl/3-hydroxydecanoyl-(acyl carrier protein) dehydratase
VTPGWLAERALQPRTLTRDQITALLPQRPPLLLVDAVTAVAAPGRPRPAVAATLEIRGDEAVLAGHFPALPIWPGSYTLEGLAQTCALAGALAAPAGGRPPALVMVAAVKVKLTGLVTPPARLHYFVAELTKVGDLHRFAVEASVKGRLVAAGTLDVAIRAGGGGAA